MKRVSKYIVMVEQPSYKILVNLKNGYVIKLDGAYEQERMQELLTGGIEIQDEFSEALDRMEFFSNTKDEMREVEQKLGKEFVDSKEITFTLLVTEQCDFRCTYCYENHCSNHFTMEMYRRIYENLLMGIRKGLYEKVHINFFGGEPLLEYQWIIKFLEKLQNYLKNKPEIKFDATMTTNGYLLTKERYEKLCRLGVRNYQITLDGFPETHDKLRILRDGSGTWETITKNLDEIVQSKEESVIVIRTNLNDKVRKDYKRFLNEIYKRYGGRFLIHFELIKEFNERVDHEAVSGEELDEEWMIDLLKECKKIGLRTTYQDEANLGNMICRMMLPNHYIIDFKGNIKKCSIYLEEEENNIGVIQKNGILCFNENANLWKTKSSDKKKCKECKIYPLCGGYRCPVQKIFRHTSLNCDVEKKERLLYKLAKEELFY